MARSIRTDLAMEVHEHLSEQEQKSFQTQTRQYDGVEVEHDENEDIKTTRVKVTSPKGEEIIGKPIGNYITLEIEGLRRNDQDIYEDAARAVAKELEAIIDSDKVQSVLVVGLGNWNVTPDALGPKVVSTVMVTRHLHEYVPEQVEDGVIPVSAVAPGVLGTTGIETGEIIRGIVDKVKPDLIIAIDALASRKTERVSTTIQIADTGITPGSGVGNKRMELSQKTMGIPVIAMGVPTVVDAATMANDAIDLVIDSMIEQSQKGEQFYSILKEIDREEKYQLIQHLLNPYTENMMVTPKEIDTIIEKISGIISNAINIALHKEVNSKDVNRFIH